MGKKRTLPFFSATYGFSGKFNVLCHGTFLHYVVENGMLPVDEAFIHLFDAEVTLYTTRCQIDELHRETYHNSALKAADHFKIAYCGHGEGCMGGAPCILEVIGKDNPHHFCVASQDPDLRRELRKVPGVPIILAQNVLCIESPSKLQQEDAKNLQRKEEEYEEIKEWKMTADEGSAGQKKKKKIELKDKPQFKRKRAKGPNPLSCLKKKKKKKHDSLVEMKEDVERSEKKKRKRKRNRKNRRNRQQHVENQ